MKTDKTHEANETDLDEAKESPEMQAQEEADGTEQHNGVPIPPEFQNAVLELFKDATSAQLDFARSILSQRQDEIYKEKEVTTDDYEAVKNSVD